MGQSVHTYPVDDLIQHDIEGGECPCGPEVTPVECDDGSIGYSIVHHSLDGREHFEPDHDRDACPGCTS